MKKFYIWFGGKKWFFTFWVLCDLSIALFCRVNPYLMFEFVAGIGLLAKLYFAANVQVKKDFQEHNETMAGKKVCGDGDRNTTVRIDTKQGGEDA